MSYFAGLSSKLVVTGVNCDASESYDSGSVKDADNLISDVQREPPPERGGGIRKQTHLQQLPPSPGFKDVESPALSLSLSCGNTLERNLEGLVKAVYCHEDIA